MPGEPPRPDSDIDLLVIEDNVEVRRREMTRLRRALSPLRIPVDVIVHSADTLDEWGALPGTFIHEALAEGKVVYEKAA